MRHRGLSADEQDASDAVWVESEQTVRTEAESFGRQIAVQLVRNDSARATYVAEFVASPEVESIVRQSIAQVYTGATPEEIAETKRRLLAFARTNPVSEQVDHQKLCDQIFEFILKSTRKALRPAPRMALLPQLPRSGLSSYWTDEIRHGAKSTPRIEQLEVAQIAQIQRFETQYRYEVGQRHGFLIPPHHSESHKVPIGDLYVAPRFQRLARGKYTPVRSLSVDGLLAQMHRAVVLGQPGGGKSSFANMLTYRLASSYDARSYDGRRVTPILVVLREYASANQQTPCSLLEHVERQAAATYQQTVPDDAFEYMLHAGRVIVIFDGLDELAQTHLRRKVADDVESFCRLYPAIPVLVTSREVGYEQTPLDSRMFTLFRLAPFDEGQVEEYVTRWFSLDLQRTNLSPDRNATAFLHESRELDDLRENPLMLGLMCNTYRGVGYIPKNRPDVYRRCSEMLFERWDAGRGIHVAFRYESELRPAVAYLARWLYENPQLVGGVTEKQLVAKTAEYLLGRRFATQVDAEAAARDFISFCSGRAWVFTDIGKNAVDENVYHFTHRTFLEYFCALSIVRTHESSEELAKFLQPYIIHREWDVVAQLAIQIRSFEIEEAADRLFGSALADAASLEPAQRWNLLGFYSRSLSGVTPSVAIVEEFVGACFEFAVSRLVRPRSEDAGRQVEWQEAAHEPLATSLSTSGDIRPIVENTFLSLCKRAIGSGKESQARLAAEYLVYVDLLISLGQSNRLVPPKELRALLTRTRASCDEISRDLQRRADAHLGTATMLYHREIVSILSIAEHHGVGTLLRPGMIVFAGKPLDSAAKLLVRRCLTADGTGHAQDTSNRWTSELSALAAIFSSSPRPLFVSGDADLSWFQGETDGEKYLRWSGISGDAAYALFVLMAAGAEHVGEDLVRVDLSRFVLEEVLRARASRRDPDGVRPLLEARGFSAEQCDEAISWCRGLVSYTRYGSSQADLGPV